MRTMDRSHHRPARRAVATGAVLALATLLAACGGGSSSDGASAGDGASTTPTELPADTGTAGTDADPGAETTAVDDGTADVDICGEITQADMEAILPEATFSSVAPNAVIPAPTCEYNIELTGGIEAAVVQILLAGEDPGYLDAQREIQADAVDVPGLDDAFAYDDFGSILVQGESGTFLVERGVELTEGGEAASQDQMIAIAQLVADL